jgi:nicotinate-nucleotide pyrophosphorylase (carboxylating)
MDFTASETAALDRLLVLALEEDLGVNGDLTSQALIPPELNGAAVLVARSQGVIAGLPAACRSFTRVDPAVQFEQSIEDGTAVEPGTRLATIRGRMTSILIGERTALNFLQRLSGVATQTRLDAVTEAVRRARIHYGTQFPVEVEVETLDQLDLALKTNPDIVLLDNMAIADLREAVRRRSAIAPGVLLEASGGVNLSTLRGIAETGVDRISVGVLTHSAVALDIALDYLA